MPRLDARRHKIKNLMKQYGGIKNNRGLNNFLAMSPGQGGVNYMTTDWLPVIAHAFHVNILVHVYDDASKSTHHVQEVYHPDIDAEYDSSLPTITLLHTNLHFDALLPTDVRGSRGRGALVGALRAVRSSRCCCAPARGRAQWIVHRHRLWRGAQRRA